MSKNQVLILGLLVVLVIGIFAVLAYLVFFQGDGGESARPTDTPTPALAAATAPAQATVGVIQAPPTPTPTRGAVVVTGDAQSVAQATVEVTAQQTAEAMVKLDAAMQQMPVGEFDLAAEDGVLRMTMKRIGWLRITQLWLKVQFTNTSGGYQTVDPAYLKLIDLDGEEYAVEESAAELPGALLTVAVEAGDSVTGDVSFRLPLDMPPAALVYDDGEGEPLRIDILSWLLSQPATTSP